MEEIAYLIGLTLVPGVGDVTAKQLVAYCGSAEEAFRQKKQHLLKIPGIGEGTAHSIISNRALDRAEKELAFMEKNNILPIPYFDERYPKKLKYCDDGPAVIFVKGQADLQESPCVGIVGTRKATEYGKKITEKLVEEIASVNPLIISGLAYGIDITAHRAALKNGLRTWGVLAHGLDRVYPGQHNTTATRMCSQGGLITEFLSETEPDRENFPKRNRIVAGMCDCIIVVEAGVKGGALITAEIAHSYNRDVFAFPGRVTDEFSIGCNRLIRNNKAALIQSGADLLYSMGWDTPQKPDKKEITQPVLFHQLEPQEEVIFNLIPQQEQIDIDTLCHVAGISTGKAAGLLLNLEFKGAIRALPGKRYSRA